MGEFIHEMGGGHGILIAAQTALLGMIQKNVVEDRGEDQGVLSMPVQKGGKGLLSDIRLRTMEHGEQFLARIIPLLSVEIKTVLKGCGHFLKELTEGVLAGQVFEVETLLLFFGKDMGFKDANMIQIVLVIRQRRIGKQLFELFIGNGDDLQFKKENFIPKPREKLPGLLEQLFMFLLFRVCRKEELGIQIGF
jgi:hypothetical protein